jgi:signal transduction histidine kinase/FixJ family two-component response regulator
VRDRERFTCPFEAEGMYKGSAESILQENHKRIALIKIIVLLCLAAIGGGGGYIMFYLLNQMEEEICALQFASVADLIQASITSNFESKVEISQWWAKEFGVDCPTAESWPNCHYDLEEFDYLTEGINGNTRVVGFAPFVSPERVEEFENYSKGFLGSTVGYPPDTGYSPFGFGVFGIKNTRSTSKHRHHDTTGVTFYGSPYRILVPTFVFDEKARKKLAMFYNLHSEPSRGQAIDILLNCHNRSRGNEFQPCDRSSLTRILQTVGDWKQPRTTAIYTPIYPRLNRTVMVGISFVYVCWDEIMNISIPSSFPEIVVVVKSDSTEISYSFNRGNSIPLGDGDHHSKNYNNFGQYQLVLSNLVDSKSAQYHIAVYPTASFCDYYCTSSPLLVLVGLISMMIIIAILFGMYDYFMESESLLRKFLLESKRLFVRFISHELRTPLTAVSLGLSLVKADLCSLISHPIYSKSMHPELIEQLKQCVQSLREASDNTDTAIVVLNDMLQYDKIESKSLQCECIETNIWEIIRHTCQELSLQAKACHITFKMNLQIEVEQEDESPPGTLARLKSSVVVGDPIKLSQVVRNLISNALKFSPPGSEVKVNGEILPSPILKKILSTGYWVPHGLLNASMPKCTKPYKRLGSIRIDVIDEGPGVTEQGKQKLFEEGVQFDPNHLQSGQGESTTTLILLFDSPPFLGSGLGLWISKGIVNIHGGSIGVESQASGKGCLFYAEFPLIEGCDSSCSEDDKYQKRIWSWTDPMNTIDHTKIITPILEKRSFHSNNVGQQDDSQKEPSNKSILLVPSPVAAVVVERPSQLRPPIHILIVDDAKSIRKILDRALTAQGHICQTACNGQECLEMVTKESSGHLSSFSTLGAMVSKICFYDLILMDSEMPVMSGPEATKIIRSLGFDRLIILGVTGNVLPEDVQVFLEHGVDAVLAKPVDLESMWREYDRIIEDRITHSQNIPEQCN